MKTLKKGFVLLALLPFQHIHAEVVVDGSLGGSGQELAGPVYNIHEGLGRRNGGNLFHSFSAFNINSGEQAQFNTSAPTDNILARVTGGHSSLIDGEISSSSSANLWLMNPAGWVVGQNAQINVNGAFHLTTAQAIGFGNGETFFADPVSDSVLSANPPIDYQFTQSNQATITLDQADLVMSEYHDVNLVGGDIEMRNASITAPGGRIVLASNSGVGQWQVGQNGLTQTAGSGGKITIEHDNQANLLSPSLNSSDATSDISSGGIQLSAEQINLKKAFVLASAWEDKHAEDTRLQARTINLDASSINTDVQGSKNAGKINILAHDLTLQNGSNISNDTELGSTGNVKGIDIELTGQLHMSEQSSVNSRVQSNNKGGDIHLTANRVTLNDTSSVRLATQADGAAGDLYIDTRHLTLNNKSSLDTATSFGRGQGGDITINAGNIDITQDGLMTSASFAEGDAGNITVHANNLSLANGSEIRAASLGSGSTGAIQLAVNKMLDLRNSSINTLAFETDGGPVQVDSRTLLLNHSAIMTSVEGEQGNGGNISVNTEHLVMNGGFIQANTAAVGAQGGDIQANADFTIAGRGKVLVGGEERQQFSPDSSLNVIQAAAPDGISGQVTLTTAELNIAGQLAKVDSSFVKRQSIANDPCSVARDQKASSLIRGGQGGLPVKASDTINLPLDRYESEDNLEPQSGLTVTTEMLAALSVQDHCTQEPY